jgi:hypothetical protein
MTLQQRLNVQRYLAAKQNGNRHRRRVDGEKIACELCGSTSDLEWHHRKYWSEGGDDSPGNRQVLCQPCHFAVHAQKDDFRRFGQWGGLVSAYLREQRLGRESFCEAMKALARRRAA